MKKILSLALAAAMMVSAIPAAYAAENEANYDAGTQIELIGSGTEEWTVTVPAKMNPGQTGTVKAEGMWAADKYLEVSAPSSVTLAYGAQTMDVGITFNGLYKIGSSIDEVSASQAITVAEAERLFGTWTGTLTYEVNLVEKGDVNRDGVINNEDLLYVVGFDSETASEEESQTLLTYGDLNANGRMDGLDERIYHIILDQNGLLPQSE